MKPQRCVVLAGIVFLCARLGLAAESPTQEEAKTALRRAVQFFSAQVSPHGGYVWRYSGDLKLCEGEGKATGTMAWVQPPGTPTVGEAFLDAYDATGERLHLDAARKVAAALLRGQLRSGGWDHHIELDPQKRANYAYRDVPERRKQQGHTSLDDDISPSAVRFLMRMDKALQFKDAAIHEAVGYALDSMLRAQYPNGGWYQWWDRYPTPASAQEFPVVPASYPETWSRTWLNDWTGCYFINDGVMSNMAATMLAAHQTYGDERYLNSALKAGDFLVLAQMPDPQPAWAQQYDRNMHPVWDRKFEPPAITALESQGVIEALMLLYRKTGKEKYLAPIPRALAYLRKSLLPDGRLARFYELRTNKPLFFSVTGKAYHLTYSRENLPEHYSFIVDSRLDALEAEYRRLGTKQQAAQERPSPPAPDVQTKARHVIQDLDPRGAWVTPGRLKHYVKIEQSSGVIDCQTFADNVKTLCQFIRTYKGHP